MGSKASYRNIMMLYMTNVWSSALKLGWVIQVNQPASYRSDPLYKLSEFDQDWHNKFIFWKMWMHVNSS